MKKYLKTIKCLFKFQLSNQMAFSVDFWISFFVDATFFVTQLLLFSVIYLQVDSINGWTKYHMMILVGNFTILDAIYMATYFFGVISLPDKIKNGTLDYYIVKPINTLFYVSFEHIQLNSLALIIPGSLMVFNGLRGLGVNLSVLQVAVYIVLMIIMLILMYNIMVILRCTAFWFTKIDAIGQLEDQLINFSFKIPGTVYKGITKIIFYFILPYGLISTIPTQALAGELELEGIIISLTLCICFTILRKIIWKKGMKRYGSASS